MVFIYLAYSRDQHDDEIKYALKVPFHPKGREENVDTYLQWRCLCPTMSIPSGMLKRPYPKAIEESFLHFREQISSNDDITYTHALIWWFCLDILSILL